MALTRPRLGQLNTNTVATSDPIQVLHAGSSSANVDVGFLMNRANGLVSNVAIYWNESGNTFVTAFTANTGGTDTNVLATSYANVTTGHHLPGANVTYNLGSPSQRWKDLWLSGTTIYLGGATISSPDTNTVTISNPNGGSFSVTGSATGQASGTFGNLVANSGIASTSTSTGALQITGGAGISGNVYIGGNLDVVGTVTFRNTVVETSTELVQGVEIVAGNLVANSGTASTNTTTGALVVAGGAGISGAVYAGSVYDNGTRVVSTSSGAGNLSISSGAITLPATGPGSVNVGSATSIPTIITDAYGRIVGLTSNSISTSFTVAGTSGTATVSGGSTLSLASTNGVTIAVGATYANISTPQDVRTSASPTFAAGTINGTLVATTVNAATVGNIGANVVGTGTYLTSLTATNVSGTVTTANVSLFDSVTALTTNQTFYPQFSNLSTTGNSITGVSSGLAYNPSTNTLNTTTFVATTVNAATIGNSGAVHTGSTLTLTSYANIAGPLVVTNNTAVQAIQVTGTSTKGGAGYHDFLLVTNQGGGTNPNKTFRLNSTGGIEIINSAYISNLFTLSDAGDLTILGKVTGANVVTTNGVFWSNGSAYSGGGTPGGSTTQIQYNNAGAFAGAANFVYASASGNVAISTTTTSTSTTTGALVVGGGIGVAGNVWAGQVYATNNGNGTNFAVGDDVWIGDINVANTTRLMGQQDNTQGYLVFGSSNATNYIGRSGTNPLTVTGAFNITGLTTVATVNAGTIGNIGANVVGTGTYLTALAGSNVNGTVATANVSLFDSVTAYTTNQTFYPNFSNISTTGNTTQGVVPSLAFNPGTGSGTLNAGTLVAATVAAATIGNANATLTGTIQTASQTNITAVGNLTALSTAGTVTSWGNIVAASGTTSTSTTTGALVVTGGVGIAGNLNVGTNLVVTGNLTVNGSTSTINNTTIETTEFVQTIDATTVRAVTIGNSGAVLTGTLSTAAQTNITSVGTLTGLTTTGTIIAATVNAATIGNISANHVGTGTYLTALTATNINGTVLTSNVSLYDSVTAYTTNQTFYPTFANVTTGNSTQGTSTTLTYNPSTGVLSATSFSGSGASITNLTSTSINGTVTTANVSIYDQFTNTSTNQTFYPSFFDKLTGNGSQWTNSSLTYNPSTGALTATSFNGVGTFSTATTSGTLIASGNIVAASGTASSSTTTGALIVTGGAGVSGAVYAGSLYDNGVRVVSTSSGAGNLTISAGAITLPATGPGASTVGSSSSIPVITTDAYGRVVALTSSAISTSFTASGTSGTTTISGGSTLSFASTNGVTIAVGATYANISTPQDVRTSASPTFASGTFNGTVIAATVNAATIGNSGATLTGTLSTAAQPNVTSVGNLTSLSVAGVTTNWGNLVAASGTASSGTTTGALVVTGGVGVSGDAYYGGNVAVINRSYVKFSPSGSSNWIGLRAPSSLSSNVTYNLPSTDGTSGQVLKTDGAGNWSFGSGTTGGSSGFFSSTVSTYPGASGNKDLATGSDNVTTETPFSAGGTDAFGVSLGIVYDQMEPVGSYSTIDLGGAGSI